ncbi:MAG: arginyltransferase [Alphaproteobacteria bacterium]
MSIISTRIRRPITFYRSSPLPCPYIPGKLERKLFTRLPDPDTSNVNGLLTAGGFRRSHDFVYRPVCENCMACKPVRIDTTGFKLSRNDRKQMKRNADLVMIERPPHATSEQYRLFARYQYMRHGDGDMAAMGPDDYAGMIEEGASNTRVVEWRLGDERGRLLAVMLVDVTGDGYSAVYSFFEPEEEGRSLGRFMVLDMARKAKAEHLPYLYLGYYIAESKKMNYKTRFKPLEVLERGRWVPMVQDEQE